MKKAVLILVCVLFVLTVLFPAGALVSDAFGYSFELIRVSGFVVTIATLSVCLVVLDLVFQNGMENKITGVLLALVMPLSLINAVFYIFASGCRIWVVACMLAYVGCCCFLAVKHGRPVTLRILTLVLSALMILPLSYLCFIASIFGNIAENTVIRTVESPDGKYYAQVIDSNQGAMGGNTFVDVYEKSGFDAILFEIQKEPQRVYEGEYGEFEGMEIYWKEDGCLVIDSVEYEME